MIFKNYEIISIYLKVVLNILSILTISLFKFT